MKKLILYLLCLAFLLLPITVSANEPESEQSNSQPLLMVTDFSVDTGSITAGKVSKISVTLTNKHKTETVKNIKVTFSASDGSVLPTKLDSVHIDSVEPQKTYVWNFGITTSETAASGNHSVTISMQYETKDGQTLSSSDNITLNVIGKETKEEKPDESAPKLMVTGYELDKEYITPGEKTLLKITVKNTHASRSVSNIKFSLSEESGEITPSGMGTAHVKNISAGGTYVWEVEITASHTVSVGEHRFNVSAEYEDSNYRSYSSSDTLRLNVRQIAKLKYDSAILPKKVVQGDNQTVTINLMNTGKSTVYNCTIDFDIEHLQSGGSTFVGNIESAQTGIGTANLRVDSNFEGEVKGKITISYEDDYGEVYTDTVDVSTVIEKKVEQLEIKEEPEKKNSLWWVFVIIGLAVGGGIGFGVPWIINDKKQRKEDDLRL